MQMHRHMHWPTPALFAWLRAGIVIVVFLAVGAPAVRGDVLHVDASSTGLQDGTSWDAAYTDLQDALDEAAWLVEAGEAGSVEVWVAEGLYKPDRGTGDPSMSFHLRSGVQILGGFAGWETDRCQRDWLANETVLSGDLLDNDPGERWQPTIDVREGYASAPPCVDAACLELVREHVAGVCDWDHWHFPCEVGASVLCEDTHAEPWRDNSFHVVRADHPSQGTILDGLTVTGGNAVTLDYERVDRGGGGLYAVGSCPILRNCKFVRNTAAYGAPAIAVWASYAAQPTTTIESCRFEENRGTYAAVFVQFGRVAMSDCMFRNNDTTGLYLDSTGPSLVVHTHFVGNRHIQAAAMRATSHSATRIKECEFHGNKGGGIVELGNALVFEGCVFNDNECGTLIGMSGGGRTVLDHVSIVNSIGTVVYAPSYASLLMSNCLVVLDDRRAYAPVYTVLAGASNKTLINCTVVGTPPAGGRFDMASGYDFQVYNSVVWGTGSTNDIGLFGVPSSSEDVSVLVAHSLVQGWTGRWPGIGTSGEAPRFRRMGYRDDGGTPDDPDDDVWVPGDYRLMPDSPGINRGLPGFDAEEVPTDLAGHPRVLCGRVDIGAYEYGAGDYNCDRSVALDDFAHWTVCESGPIAPASNDGGEQGDPLCDPACRPLDFDMSCTVDLADFARFQTAFMDSCP